MQNTISSFQREFLQKWCLFSVSIATFQQVFFHLYFVASIQPNSHIRVEFRIQSPVGPMNHLAGHLSSSMFLVSTYNHSYYTFLRHNRCQSRHHQNHFRSDRPINRHYKILKATLLCNRFTRFLVLIFSRVLIHTWPPGPSRRWGRGVGGGKIPGTLASVLSRDPTWLSAALRLPTKITRKIRKI